MSGKKIKLFTFFTSVILICIALVFIYGFTKAKLTSGDYMTWVEDATNGLKQEKAIGNIIFQLQYKPQEYVVARENRDINLNQEILNKRKEELKDMQYYNLRIKSKDNVTEPMALNAASEQDYLNRSSYYSFSFQNDISLVSGTDTLHCVLFNNVRNYGVAPYTDFVFAFPMEKDNILNDRYLIIDDKVFGSGQVIFCFKKEIISNIPFLRTE